MTQRNFAGSLDVDIDLPVAGAASRGLARMVDLLLVGVVQTVLWVVVGAGLALLYAAGVGSPGVLIGVFLVLTFLTNWFMYTALEVWTRGQPPGKRLLKLRVVRDDGGEITLVPAMIRNLLRLDALPGGVVFDLAFMLVSDDGKRFGDLAAGTLVVDESNLSAPARTWPAVLAAPEVAILEAWFRRAPDLEPERRQVIAEKLAARISSAHPGLLSEQPAVLALEQLAPVRI